MATTEEKTKARTMREAGASYAVIGKELGYDGTTVQYWLDPRRKKQASTWFKTKYHGDPKYKLDCSEKKKSYRNELNGRCRGVLAGTRYNAKTRKTKPCNATVEELSQALIKQDFRCAITGVHENDIQGQRKKLHADHDGKTGEFRGWILPELNLALGKANDDPAILRQMAEYLESRQCPKP